MVGVGGKCGPARAQRRLALNAIAGGGANFIKIGIQLVMLPLMAHLLGPSEFGLYALALPTISFFMIFRPRRARGLVGARIARRDDYLVDRVLAGAARRHGADDDRDRIRICPWPGWRTNRASGA